MGAEVQKRGLLSASCGLVASQQAGSIARLKSKPKGHLSRIGLCQSRVARLPRRDGMQPLFKGIALI